MEKRTQQIIRLFYFLTTKNKMPITLLLVFIFIILCLICGWLSRIYKLLVEVFDEEEEESDLPENNLVEYV
jgi:hypothetical protein